MSMKTGRAMSQNLHFLRCSVVCILFTLPVFQAGAATFAQAFLQGCSDEFPVSGIATLTEIESTEGVKEVDVYLQMSDLTEGEHAVHIHETAACEPCGAAGGHFDPGPASFTSPDGNHPFHSGDLINIDSVDGLGVMTTTTSRLTLSPGVLSIFDEDGSAFIVHVDPDTYCPEGEVAGCAGGARAACGIILPADVDETLKIAVSESSKHKDARGLNRTTVGGKIYVFLSPEEPETDIETVDFYLNGEFVKTETTPPYDMQGTKKKKKAAPFDTRHLDDGEHTVAVLINLASGEQEVRSAKFQVFNAHQRDAD